MREQIETGPYKCVGPEEDAGGGISDYTCIITHDGYRTPFAKATIVETPFLSHEERRARHISPYPHAMMTQKHIGAMGYAIPILLTQALNQPDKECTAAEQTRWVFSRTDLDPNVLRVSRIINTEERPLVDIKFDRPEDGQMIESALPVALRRLNKYEAQRFEKELHTESEGLPGYPVRKPWRVLFAASMGQSATAKP